jgi:hypothetical protein
MDSSATYLPQLTEPATQDGEKIRTSQLSRY